MGPPTRPTDVPGWVRTSKPKGDEAVRYSPGHTFLHYSAIGLIEVTLPRSIDGAEFSVSAWWYL
jgi:hypothetical protein